MILRIPISYIQQMFSQIMKNRYTFSLGSFWAGNVSTGLIHATPGDIKSFRSSAERMALIFAVIANAQRAAFLGDRTSMYNKIYHFD